jgi:plastocyanin
MGETRMTSLLSFRIVTALFLGIGLAAAFDPAHAAKRHIVVTAVEPKGGANVDKETFPAAALPEGKGYGLKQPDQTGRWEVSVYVWDPRQIFVDEGDEVVLEFVGINGASHPTTISGYDKTFELKRGEVTKVSFVADKPGRFEIVCATHHPTMVAELIVAAKK